MQPPRLMVNSTSHVRTSLDHQIQQLAAFEPTAFPVLSLYLDLSPNQHGRDQHGTFVRKALGERVRSLRPNTPERESIDRDAARIEQYLRDEVRPSANGLAIFACSGVGFFDAVQLHTPVERHWLFTGQVPHLYPLVRLVDQTPLRRGDARYESRADLRVRPRYSERETNVVTEVAAQQRRRLVAGPYSAGPTTCTCGASRTSSRR